MRNEWLPKDSRTAQDRRTEVEIRVDDLVELFVRIKAVPKDEADDLKHALDCFVDSIIEEVRR